MPTNIPINVNPYAPVDYSQLFIRQVDPYWQEKAMGGPLGVLFNQINQLRALKEQQARQKLQDYLTLAQIYPEMRPTEEVQKSWQYVLGRPTWLGLGRGVGAPEMPITSPLEQQARFQIKSQLEGIRQMAKAFPSMVEELEKEGMPREEAEKLLRIFIGGGGDSFGYYKNFVQANAIKTKIDKDLETKLDELSRKIPEIPYTQLASMPYFKYLKKTVLSSPGIANLVGEYYPYDMMELADVPVDIKEQAKLNFNWLVNYFTKVQKRPLPLKVAQEKALDIISRLFPVIPEGAK